MKRSKMIELIAKHIPYNPFFDSHIIANDILKEVEEFMLPPETSTVSCSDPDIFLKIDNPDAGFTIPSHFILGWDDE